MASENPNDNQREKWWVTNKSKAMVGISDLPKVPIIEAQWDRVDVLRYYSRGEVGQSKQLAALIKAGYLRLKKVKPYGSKNISKGEAPKAITPAEEDEIPSLDNYYTKAQVRELIGGLEVVTITDDYDAEDNEVILCDASTKDITVNLPEASESVDKYYYIKRIDGSANSVFIDGYDDEEIDGNEIVEITVQNTSLHVVCDGGEWWII